MAKKVSKETSKKASKQSLENIFYDEIERRTWTEYQDEVLGKCLISQPVIDLMHCLIGGVRENADVRTVCHNFMIRGRGAWAASLSQVAVGQQGMSIPQYNATLWFYVFDGKFFADDQQWAK